MQEGSNQLPKDRVAGEAKPMSKLERILTAKGKTPGWLAAQFNVSRAAVHHWLAGSKKPRRSRIPKLANLLGVGEMELTYLIWPERESGDPASLPGKIAA